MMLRKVRKSGNGRERGFKATYPKCSSAVRFPDQTRPGQDSEAKEDSTRLEDARNGASHLKLGARPSVLRRRPLSLPQFLVLGMSEWIQDRRVHTVRYSMNERIRPPIPPVKCP